MKEEYSCGRGSFLSIAGKETSRCSHRDIIIIIVRSSPSLSLFFALRTTHLFFSLSVAIAQSVSEATCIFVAAIHHLRDNERPLPPRIEARHPPALSPSRQCSPVITAPIPSLLNPPSLPPSLRSLCEISLPKCRRSHSSRRRHPHRRRTSRAFMAANISRPSSRDKETVLGRNTIPQCPSSFAPPMPNPGKSRSSTTLHERGVLMVDMPGLSRSDEEDFYVFFMSLCWLCQTRTYRTTFPRYSNASSMYS